MKKSLLLSLFAGAALLPGASSLSLAAPGAAPRPVSSHYAPYPYGYAWNPYLRQVNYVPATPRDVRSRPVAPILTTSTEQSASSKAPGKEDPDALPARETGPSSPSKQVLWDLDHLLNYALYEGEVVPRVSIRELPEKLDQITDQADRKNLFLRLLLPLVLMENERLADLRGHMLKNLQQVENGGELGRAEVDFLKGLARRYRVKGNPLEDPGARDELREKVDELPVSLALAQAANESAWGRSRFAREGRNLFGIWTYDESQGIVPKKRAPGKKHLVRRFNSLQESVRYYLFTLNSHPAYTPLRELRHKLRAEGKPLDGLSLAAGLEKYSARGKEYISLIRDIIRRHGLEALNGKRLVS